MTLPQEPSQCSTDYYGDENSQFLEALAQIPLPGDTQAPPPNQLQDKAITIEEDDDEEMLPPSPSQPCLKRRFSDIENDHEPEGETLQVDPNQDIYGASSFGGFSEYMRRKRAKLQIQNKEFDHTVTNQGPRGIFEGLAIYVNGWTQPSVQELRKIIVENGGIYQPYLDRKSIITHIITCSLTPAKVNEFKNMKVVIPEWITDSVAAKQLLPWKDYVFQVTERTENSQGKPANQQIFNITKPPIVQLPANDQTFHNRTRPIQKSLGKSKPPSDNEAVKIPEYAAAVSNPNAQRVMANSDWRKAHTSIAPDFIEGYYKNSRLHHLSTWKTELRALVLEAQERVDLDSSNKSSSLILENPISMRGEHFKLRSPPRKWKGKGKANSNDIDDRVIMHCDFDCFFVSAGLVSRPELKGKPVVVCHSQGAQGGETSTSEIASSSYEARSFGIKNGMSLQQARKLCPQIITIPYEFERYKEYSLKFYTVLLSYADDLQAVSVDEALIDVSNAVQAKREALQAGSHNSHNNKDPAKEVAESIRDAVRKETGCEVSIGVAHNILLARLATRRAKPAKSYHLTRDEVADYLSPLEVSDLHGFGSNMKQKVVERLGTCNLGDLMYKSKGALCDALGKTTGETLYNAIRGIDERRLESSKERKSVSCDINYGIRFENNEQAEAFIYKMAEEVKRRLDEVKMLGRMISLKIMKRDPSAPVEPPKFLGCGKCVTFSKQTQLVGMGGSAVNDDKLIGEHAWRMLKSLSIDPKELRGIGIQINKLLPAKEGDSSNLGGQSVLSFKKVEGVPRERHSSPKKALKDVEPNSKSRAAATPKLNTERGGTTSPTKPKPDIVDLPSFSQVDMTVFQALPKELQEEITNEYRRRSESPAVDGVGPSRGGPPNLVRRGRPSAKPDIFPQRPAIGRGTNFKRIAQQLAPQHGSSIFTNKALLKALGLDKPKKPPVKVTDAEMRELDIDWDVFYALPVKIQREQLIRARLIKKNGSVPDAPTQRVVIKPTQHISRRRRRPPPKAEYIQPPILRQQGKQKKEKFCYFETNDIQQVIEKWVTGYRHWVPKDKDVAFFSKYLVQCLESKEGDGMERGVSIMKWWLVLLRRIWGEYEGWQEDEEEEESKDPNERAALAWWKAFRVVKQRLDDVAKKRFGGKLSLK